MPSLTAKVGLAAVALVSAVLFQSVRQWMTVFGYGRITEPITNFPYICRRLYEPLATNSRPHAAEDMWLSGSTRTLFIAGSDQHAQKQWFPNMGFLNLTGRSEIDAVIALDIDALDPALSSADASTYRVLKTPGFKGTAGDGHLHLLNIRGVESDNGIEFYLVNNRPSVDASTGELLDQAVTGANATIEVFSTDRKATELKHVRTYAHKHIVTPNNVAPVPGADGGFYITNDHGQNKVGMGFNLSPFIGTGDVTYCDTQTCKVVSRRHAFPNGLLIPRHDPGHLYVPSSFGGGVYVYAVDPSTHELKQVAHVAADYSIDNLSEDGNGDIYAAAFPKPLEAFGHFEDPELRTYATATVLRIRRDGAGFVWDKVLEDRDRTVLGGATTAVHDAKTGRLFISGVISPFIAVCEPQGVRS